MGRTIGCWSWSENDAALVRDDGATLRFAGQADGDLDYRGGRWLRFEIRCSEGSTPLLVQHRLVGFDAQHRTLCWRADFTRHAIAGAAPPASYRQWMAFERIAADGLACWPQHVFEEVPDWVAIEGGWEDDRFIPDRYRLYERVQVKRFLTGGRLPELDQAEPRWSFRPLDPKVSSPTPAEAAKIRSGPALRNALRQMAARGPALVAGDRTILLAEDEHGCLHATYLDEDFVSDRYTICNRYRTQEDRWEIGDYAVVDIGARRLKDARAAERNPVRGLIGLFFKQPERDHQGRENWAVDPLLVERATRSFAAALFHVPKGAFSERRLFAPPKSLWLGRSWFQAGYLQSRMLVAHSLDIEEFVAAFADRPPLSMTVQATKEVAFDVDRASLEGPGGQALAFDRSLESTAEGPKILLRCTANGLDWPIVVQQSMHRRRQYRPWSIDHDASLALWRSKMGIDLPDAAAWDCLRQFVEDALLSWGDTDSTGPAPQRLITRGGYYDGIWRGPELVRTVDRPLHYQETVEEPVLGPWSDYRPQGQWRRTDSLPIDLPEREYPNHYGDPRYKYGTSPTDTEPPIQFRKEMLDGTGSFHASAWHVGHHRDEVFRTDFADYRAADGWVRLAALRSRVSLGRVWELDEDSAAVQKWQPRPSLGAAPPLALWRSLRDAAQGGLRPGESVTTTGAWIFNRFYGGPDRSIELRNES